MEEKTQKFISQKGLNDVSQRLSSLFGVFVSMVDYRFSLTAWRLSAWRKAARKPRIQLEESNPCFCDSMCICSI
jgi:hypothetical protein